MDALFGMFAGWMFGQGLVATAESGALERLIETALPCLIIFVVFKVLTFIVRLVIRIRKEGFVSAFFGVQLPGCSQCCCDDKE